MKLKQKHCTPSFQQSPWVKTMTWATIAAQVAIPLSAAFTPAMLLAATEKPGQHSENTLTTANAATRLANIIGSDNAAREAGSMLLNRATSVTSSTVQNWLNQFGTARVELNLQNDFSLDGSQFDLLLPLRQTQTLLTFGQVGIRYIDDQTTANLGFGQRHFADQWMLGYNLFLDHNLSRSHTRLGIGTEYYRDYFKLAANGYIALSNWKNSRNLQGYDEKPADGFDIRTETYLPFLPQLGAKLMYEQYFGKDVGLFGKDNRQQNPYAVTLGLNYTPIPLITAGVDYQAGRGGLSDTRFNLGVNYMLGVPWSEQTNPDTMALKRTLVGSRYDLVERNNQIVLQYREQKQVTLSLAERLEGTDGQSLSLQVKATARQGVSDIQWNTAAFITAGGQLINTGNDWQVVLPHYLPNGNNTYHISGIAYDTKGHASQEAHSQITVTGYGVNTSHSSLLSVKDLLPADGKANTLIELTLLNDQQQPVIGTSENITFTTEFTAASTPTHKTGQAAEISEPVPHHLSEVTESLDQPGHYQAILTAGSIPGTVRIATLINGKPQTDLSAKIQLTADQTTATGTLILANTEYSVTGQNNSVIATILDAYHNPLTDYTVTFVGVPGGDQSIQTNESGVATLTFSSTKAGEYPISITVGENSQQVTARFIDPVAISQISVNNQKFAANSGFPTHAFAGATFDILINHDTKGYTWKSDSDAVSVSDKGTVTINQEPGKGKEVTISIESKLNPDDKTSLKFKVNHWWKYLTHLESFDASWCSKTFGNEYKFPHYQDITTATKEKEAGQRTVGTLYGEWGNMSAYGWHTHETAGYYWTNKNDSDGRYTVRLYSGELAKLDPESKHFFVCMK